MKPWWKSKTVWVGILTVLISALDYVSRQDWTDLSSINWPLFASGLLMVFLRWLTDKPITSVSKRFDFLRRKKPD